MLWLRHVRVSAGQQRGKVLTAMHEWEKYTCLKFRPKNSGDIDYIQILDGDA